MGSRQDYWVLRAGQPGTQVIIKLAGADADEPSFERAAAIHRLVRTSTNTPMADFLLADDSFRSVPFRFSVQKAVEGESWFCFIEKSDPLAQEEGRRSIGAAVSQLHALSFGGFGEFGRTGEPLLAPSHAEALLSRAHQRLTPPCAERFAQVVESNRGLLDSLATGTLCHDDLHGFNILVRGGPKPAVQAILDFDKAWIGSAESDLARMELWRGMSSEALWEGYGRRFDKDYELRRPIYQLLWCLEFRENSVDHLSTTNALLHQFGQKEVEAFD